MSHKFQTQILHGNQGARAILTCLWPAYSKKLLQTLITQSHMKYLAAEDEIKSFVSQANDEPDSP